MRYWIVALGSCCLAGCAVNPSVRYTEASSAGAVKGVSDQLIDSFYMQSNVVRVQYKDADPNAKPPTSGDLVVINTKVEDQTHRLMLLRGDSLWSDTTVNLVKVENTDLVASAGVEVQDRRVEVLNSVGAIAKAVVPLVVGAAGPPTNPICADFPATPCDVELSKLVRTRADGSAANSRGLKVVWGPVPKSAMDAPEFYQNLASSKAQGLFYASCRDVTVTYVRPAGGGKGQLFQWRGKVADPQWIDYVAFPRKGSVRMHSQCGVSVTNEKDPTQPLDVVVSAAVIQAIAVKDAVDKAGKDDQKN